MDPYTTLVHCLSCLSHQLNSLTSFIRTEFNFAADRGTSSVHHAYQKSTTFKDPFTSHADGLPSPPFFFECSSSEERTHPCKNANWNDKEHRIFVAACETLIAEGYY